MRFIFTAIIMVFWTNASQAQIFEVGPYLGGANFIGDVGSTTYIRPNSLAFGGVLKWNRSPRHSWRASAIYSTLKADDADSNQNRRRERGYSFSNGLLELNLGMEFNFWEFDVYAREPQVTPYISTGITGILTHDKYVEIDGNEIETKGSTYGFALPMILGVKGRISHSLVLAAEIGARMTFYDNLDGSTPSEFGGDESEYKIFGNQNTNDWYMFTGVTLTYTFGRKECYDVY